MDHHHTKIRSGAPATTEAAILAEIRRCAVPVRVIPRPTAIAAFLQLDGGNVRTIYRRLLERGEIAQLDDGTYYLPSDGPEDLL